MEKTTALFYSFLYFAVGLFYNNIALVYNHNVMPIRDANANYVLLTDITRLPFTSYYVSIGDILIFSGVLLFGYFIYKCLKTRRISDKHGNPPEKQD